MYYFREVNLCLFLPAGQTAPLTAAASGDGAAPAISDVTVSRKWFVDDTAVIPLSGIFGIK